MPEPSIIFNWPAVVLSMGVLSGILLSVRLWTLKTGPTLANQLLAFTMGTITLMVATALFVFSPYLSFSFTLIRIAGTITLSYGPLIYLYLQASIRKDFRMRGRQFLHFILPAIFLLITILHLFFPDSTEQQVFLSNEFVIPWQIRVIGMVILLYIITYCVSSARSINRHRRFVLEHSSYSDELHSKWLIFLFPIFLLPFLFVIFNFIFLNPFELPLPAIGAAIMLVILHSLLIFVPQVFAGFPEELQADQEEDLFTPKYQSSSLEESQKERLHEQAIAFMTSEQAFLKQDLTLHQLANSLKINSKYLSQVINEKSGKHFMDFVNEYRVNLAKEILLKSSYQHYTIVAIAQEVGFKSRSAFYASFKKFTGQTPSEYKAAQ